MGEVIVDQRWVTPDGEVQRHTQHTAFSRWDDDRGYKLFHNRSEISAVQKLQFHDDLTDQEVGRMCRLSRYLTPEANVLAYRGNKNEFKPMTPETMAKALRTNVRSVYRLLDKARNYGVIRKVTAEGETLYYMNPLYFSASRYIPLNLYILFRDEIDKYLPGWAIERYRLMELQNEPK